MSLALLFGLTTLTLSLACQPTTNLPQALFILAITLVPTLGRELPLAALA
jgi:hypothetical protein